MEKECQKYKIQKQQGKIGEKETVGKSMKRNGMKGNIKRQMEEQQGKKETERNKRNQYITAKMKDLPI